MKRTIIWLCLIALSIGSPAAVSKTESSRVQWSHYVEHALGQLDDLALTPTELSYVSNLNAIRNKKAVLNKEKVLALLLEQLAGFDIEGFSDSDFLDAEILRYELSLNLDQARLEKKWLESGEKAVSNAGIFHQTNGREWYALFLQRWVDRAVSPERMFTFGLAEIKRVNARIDALKQQLGLEQFALKVQGARAFLKTAEEVQSAFEQAHLEIPGRLAPYFPDINEVPELSITRGRDAQMSQVPGFYNNNTLYFNFFEQPYARRQVEWLYLHEAVPGHHYQLSLANRLSPTAVQQQFPFYPAFAEGWAAYVEDVAVEQGVYSDRYQEYGKWEWDMVRSVRVALDVGINYYGWDDHKALAFWQSHIDGRDDVALREIARMKRWPAQVVSYKYGAAAIRQMRSDSSGPKKGSLRDFHRRVLSIGSVPLSVLAKSLHRRAEGSD